MRSPRFYVDYILHFLTSHSRHGTHSPFVYKLVDEVIYAPRRSQEPLGKVERLIARLIARFTPDTVYRIGEPLPTYPLDLVIVNGNDVDRLTSQLRQLWSQLHTGSVLVLIGIYRGKQMRKFWRTLQKRPDVTVTVDLFHLGMVFFHEGQAKEDFRIRF
ncbi:hypothetical protein GCM10011386_15480 [Parapedobacter defluvii]|uniref:Uncharacterized protein n=2 Tax=Parapedobacter defluvii TaxID=2045106 RepID=A0ABQ1LIS9_9SPHI|nr:hypothetical protein GCM10011386_15480 [Parapedobacter defluvii]